MNKKLLKYLFVLAVILLIIFNWGYIDWFFNYKTVRENLGYLARKTVGLNNVTVYFSDIASLSLPSQSSSTTQIQLKPKVADITKPSPVRDGVSNGASYISAPSIGVKAPISFTQSKSQKVFANLLNVGVLHYPDSALPGAVGTAIILGHSAPLNWPKIRYDSVFNNLNNLKPGDEISIDFQGESYKYSVENTFFCKSRGRPLTILDF